MNLQNDYPEVWNFLSGYFPDSDFDILSDEEIVMQYRSDVIPNELEQSKKEISNLILNISLYWKEVSISANRYFNNSNECRSWLEEMKSILEK